MRHAGGGVPFVAEIPGFLVTNNNATGHDSGQAAKLNGEVQGRITVAVNNTHTPTTILQGTWRILDYGGGLYT